MSGSYSLRGRRPLPPQSDSAPGGNFRQKRGQGQGSGDSNKRVKFDQGGGNATSILYLGNVPKDWNEKIIESVVKGSGNIVDIRTRIDPSGRSKNYVFVEYQTPEQATRALRLISGITFGNRRFKVELSKEGFKAGLALREPLTLSRDHLPSYVVLPPEMLQEDNSQFSVGNNNFNQIPNGMPPVTPQFQRNAPPALNQGPPAFNQGPPGFGGRPQPPSFNQTQAQPQLQPPPVPPQFGGNNTSTAASYKYNDTTPQIAIPDILANASQTLPPFNPSTFTMNEKISQNLSTIDPPALIQMISLLKSSDVNGRQMALNANPSYTINVVQALILMGVIDKSALQTALQQNAAQPPQTPQPPQLPQHQQHQPPNPPRFNNQRNTNNYNAQPPVDPRWAHFPQSTIDMLSGMPAEQAQSLVQILNMTQAQINALPMEHRSTIMSLRSNYL